MMTIKPTTGAGSGRVTARMTAVVAAAVAVLLAAGCSGGDGDGRSDRAAESPSAASSATTDPARTGNGNGNGKDTGMGEDADRKDLDAIPPGPKVPKSELTPATGTLTKKQKKYLTDRVPKGTDPVAILEAGQEACDRIARTAGHDRKAAINAIRSGEITGARDAIALLCPEHTPLLKAAEKGSRG
jgi:hypothetical protein